MKQKNIFKSRKPGFIIASVILLSAIVIASGAAHWGYNDHNGPDHWEELGFIPQGLMSQSPVNIITSNVDDDDVSPLQLYYSNNVNLNVEHNGHTIKANVPGGAGTLILNGKSYTLAQFHFHHQSEHEINSKLYPVEMHLVHQAYDGELAVVGVLYDNGCGHQELNKVISVMPGHEGENVGVGNFNLRKLLPTSLRSYRYNGSLTTPECDEGVNWIVLKSIQQMSASQIDAFNQLFSGEEFPEGNRRPVQPLNGRTILTEDD